MKLKINCKKTLLDDFKYEIIENQTQIAKGQIDLTYTLKNLLHTDEVYHSRIKLNDDFIIYRHIPTLIRDDLFTLKIGNKKYHIKKGHNMCIPDIYIRTEEGKLTLLGHLNTQEFTIQNKNNTLATIKGIKNPDKETVKTYEIEYKTSTLKLQIITLCICLDILYSHY